jgi:hypothetical protein
MTPPDSPTLEVRPPSVRVGRGPRVPGGSRASGCWVPGSCGRPRCGAGMRTDVAAPGAGTDTANCLPFWWFSVCSSSRASVRGWSTPPGRRSANLHLGYPRIRSPSTPILLLPAALRSRHVLTAGPTGIALLYADARNADVCRFAPNGTLIARMDSGFARAGDHVGSRVPYLSQARGSRRGAAADPAARRTAYGAVDCLHRLWGIAGLSDYLRPRRVGRSRRAEPLRTPGWPGRRRLHHPGRPITGHQPPHLRRRHAGLRRVRTPTLPPPRRPARRPGWRRPTHAWWRAPLVAPRHTPPRPGRGHRVPGSYRPSAARLALEHRRLRQLGCPACGRL